jgi:hypothetical protein
MTLTVPAPILKQDSSTGPKLGFDRPIEVGCTGITFPDGRPLVLDNALDSGFLLYRELPPQGIVTAWDERHQGWVPAVPGPEPQPLLFHEEVWQMILIALGQKDVQDQDKFLVPPQGQPLPRYFVRTFFSGEDVHGERHEGASPPSNVVELDSAPLADERAGIVFEPPDLKQTQKVSIFLKHPTLLTTGQLTLQTTSTGITATLSVGTNSLVVDEAGIHVTGPFDSNGFPLP